MCNQIQLRERASYCARSWRQQTDPSRKNNFPRGSKCYKTIDSYVSCAFIEIWSTWEVWRALKKLEFLSATPRATLRIFQISSVLHISMNARWRMNQLLNDNRTEWSLTKSDDCEAEVRFVYHESYYQLIIKITISDRRRIAKLRNQGKWNSWR